MRALLVLGIFDPTLTVLELSPDNDQPKELSLSSLFPGMVDFIYKAIYSTKFINEASEGTSVQNQVDLPVPPTHLNRTLINPN